MEFWPDGIGRAGRHPYECLGLLEDAGFTLTRWDLGTGERQPVRDARDVWDTVEDLARSEKVRYEGGPRLCTFTPLTPGAS
jgi:hypothetical protein